MFVRWDLGGVGPLLLGQKRNGMELTRVGLKGWHGGIKECTS